MLTTNLGFVDRSGGNGITPTPVKKVWGAKVIYVLNPERNRLGFWPGRAKFYVTISNENGITPEQEQAGPVNDAWWKYETEVPGNGLVQAFDLAGNVTRQEA